MYFPGIEAFLAIVRTESISKAAELLHLSQATVSYRLKTLEQEMGTQNPSDTKKGRIFLALRKDGMLSGGKHKSLSGRQILWHLDTCADSRFILKDMIGNRSGWICKVTPRRAGPLAM